MNRADAILGRRYRWADGSAEDFTVVSYDPQRDLARVHVRSGERGELTGAGLDAGLRAGVFEEAEAAPFELPEAGLLRRGWVVRRNGRTRMVASLRTGGES